MRIWILPLLLLLAGCDPSAERIEASRAQSALDAELAGRQAAETTDCISTFSGQALDVIDNRTLVYRTPRVTYVNRLEGACPGLSRFSRLIVEPTDGSRYCRLDRVRPIDPGSSIPGAVCPLGRFTAYPRR